MEIKKNALVSETFGARQGIGKIKASFGLCV